MAQKNVISLNNDEYAIIDLDSGTVLGTNIVLVRVPDDEQEWENITSNDNEAWTYGTENGIPVTVDI